MPAAFALDEQTVMVFPNWRKSWTAPLRTSEPPKRFDANAAVLVSHADQLASMTPQFVRSLSTMFDVDAIAGRLSPVLLSDKTVAIFALAEHVGSDQADELARRISGMGFVSAEPARYVLAAPLLLAIARNQLTAESLATATGLAFTQSTTALADAFRDMVEWGVRQGASDIHLNGRLAEPESEVKYTVSGRYLAPERFRRMPTSTLLDMLSVAWMDIRGGNGAVFDPGIEQQGSMLRRIDGKDVMIRWASLAADAGPSICLRLLARDASLRLPGLAELGYLPDQVEMIDRAMMSEGGAVVFAGAVGSGKSTSLASLLCSLPAQRKLITLEDPVEYVIPGAIQNTVARNLDVSAHNSYASKLRAIKRSAMSDVLLGEIRDHETGRAFMDLAGSGVNIYTTVHAPSAALIPQRLTSDFIGVTPGFLDTPDIFKLLVFQVLVPMLCMQCALPAKRLLDGGAHINGLHRSGAQWKAWLELIEHLHTCKLDGARIRNPKGCPACRQARLPELNGYAGRTVAAEIIEPAVNADPKRSALQTAILKAAQGQVDLRDIEWRFQAFETQCMRRQSAAPAGPGSRRLRAVP